MEKPVCISKQRIHRGHVIDISVDRVELPNGNTIELDMVRHPGAAAIVPVDDQGNVLLVRQVRYATGDWLLEVPAGKLEDNEAPDLCALRELEEETGHRAGKLVSMGFIWTTPGFCNERIHLYLATQLQATQQNLDQDEILTVESMPLDDAVARATTGEITDAKSVCALLRARHYLADT